MITVQSLSEIVGSLKGKILGKPSFRRTNRNGVEERDEQFAGIFNYVSCRTLLFILRSFMLYYTFYVVI